LSTNYWSPFVVSRWVD